MTQVMMENVPRLAVEKVPRGTVICAGSVTKWTEHSTKEFTRNRKAQVKIVEGVLLGYGLLHVNRFRGT